MLEIVLVIAFLSYIGYREWMYHSHIKDLETKLIAKTPHEYQIYKKAEAKAPKSTEPLRQDEIVDPFDISPEEALEALKNGK